MVVPWGIERVDGGQDTDPKAGNLDFGTVAPLARLVFYLYPWADGLTPRSDGLTWACNEFEIEGTHSAQAAESKVGQKLLQFFLNSAYQSP